MPDIMQRIGTRVLVVEGAMGTMLQRADIPPEQCPEQLNVTAPEIVEAVHRDYSLAGADCSVTNTFGGTRVKLDEYGLGDMVRELNLEGVRLARRAGAPHVLADVGPTGLLMEPLGGATFDEVSALFAEQVEALAAGEPDAVLIETMTDIAEARCALLAARSVTDLPVFVTVTFDADGRMELSGTPPEAAAVILEACGASVVGINCGLGPERMEPLVSSMASATALPVLVQPNAGIPRLEDGRTLFPGTADEMGRYAARFVAAGAALVGSCCGSTPAFTGAISDLARGVPLEEREAPGGLALASPRRVVRIGPGRPIAAIGERINPTGRRELADSLKAGSTAAVRDLAVSQERAGADLLDVNVGAGGVDRAELFPAAVSLLAGLVDAPLVFDETDPEALERALKRYPGRPLINSVNGGEESMDTLLPLAGRFGAAVLILTLDDDGIPEDAEGRLRVAERVRAAAHGHGLGDDDLAVDCLTLTVATTPSSQRIAVEAVWTVAKQWGLATVLGVSNISHGLPDRPTLNAAFLAMAASAGLSAAIVDPLDEEVARYFAASRLLTGHDEGAEGWVARADADVARADAGAADEPGDGPGGEHAPDPERELAVAVTQGDAERAPALVEAVLAVGHDPRSIITDVLTPAIQDLGDAYGRGEVFLPQLITAADAMKAAVARVKEELPEGSSDAAGMVAFGTVKGDVHSIGKDICVSMLESAGYAVRDLGVDVDEDRFVEAATTVDVVCLSALMTTTLPSMERTAARLAGETGAKVLVGGAVVDADLAERFGVGYADDAPGCVREVGRLLGGERA